MRPNFLTNPRARWIQAPRKYQSAADYASPIVINTRSRWRAPDWLLAIALVVVCAGIGLMLAWRG